MILVSSCLFLGTLWTHGAEWGGRKEEEGLIGEQIGPGRWNAREKKKRLGLKLASGAVKMGDRTRIEKSASVMQRVVLMKMDQDDWQRRAEWRGGLRRGAAMRFTFVTYK